MAENTNVSKNDVSKNGRSAAASDGQSASAQPALLPPVDVIEDVGGILLIADLPGVPKDKLNLQLETDSLTIEGEVTIDMPQGMESGHAEIRVPRYRRVFTLSKELEGEKATAEFKNGVLKVRIPKAEHAQPRKIQINPA
jgi:HSP20 family molecular chaperone IbpA